MQEEKRILQGRFRLVKTLGEGAQGRVYLAYDLKLGKYWAVKELPSGDGKEAEIMRRLEHPALPRIVDILEGQECRYMVMDYLEGFTLEEIKKKRKIPWKEKIHWGLQLCALLEYLHGPMKGIIYQDLKPSNIIISLSGELSLLDFGIAGLREEERGSGYGTRGFAAPEQYRGEADEQSDIYGLGAVLRYMADTKEAKSKWHREWMRIVQKCMEKKRSRRYRSATAVKKELQRLERQRQGRRRVYMGTIFAAAGLLFLLEANVRQRERLLDAGALLVEKNSGELTDTTDYEEARRYFLENRENSGSRNEYQIILGELEKDARDADWKLVAEAVERLEEVRGTSWEKGREKVFLAHLCQAYGAEMGMGAEAGLKKAAGLLQSAMELVEASAGETFAPVYRIEILRQLAKNYEMQGKTEESLELYKKLLQEKIPEEIIREARLSMASLYRREKEYKRAEECYEKLLELFPEDAEIYCAYALMEALERGNTEKSEKIMKDMETRGVAADDFNSEKVRRILQKLREEEK